MRPWAVIARKEVKEVLRTRKMLLTLVVTPIAVWVLIGLVHAFIFGMAMPGGPITAPLDLYLTVEDDGEFGQLAKEIIYSVCKRLENVEIHEVGYEDAMGLIDGGEVALYIRIPANFTERLMNEGRAEIEVWLDPTSVRASAVAEAITMTIEGAMEEYVRTIDVDRRFIRGVPFTLVMVSFILVMSALYGPMPVITTSFAGEREKKTLEILLVTPVKRTSILLGKLLAAGLAAAIYLASSVIGLAMYNCMVLWAVGGGAEAIGGDASPVAMTGFALTLDQSLIVILAALLSVFLSASTGIVVSSFAKTVKDAESRYSALIVVPLTFMMATLFIRLGDLPLAMRIAVWAVPFVHGVLIIQGSIIYRQPWHLTLASALYMLAWIVGALVIGARLFEREEIVETRKMRRPRELLALFKMLGRMERKAPPS